MSKKFYNGVDLVNQRIVNLADPSAATDAVTKQYVDALVNGLSWKSAVRAATTANGALATAFANGQVIDGVTLATGDRILLKNQTTQSENGIYIVAASGAPTRAPDADSAAELVNATVYVSQGTTQADTAYTQTANAPITLGTTALTWTTVGGGTPYVGGNGLILTGTTFDVVAGTGISVAADSVGIDTAVVVRKYAASIGNGSSTSIAVIHGLGTKDITYSIQAVSTGEFVDCDAVATDNNTLTLTFAVAPSASQFRVVVHG